MTQPARPVLIRYVLAVLTAWLVPSVGVILITFGPQYFTGDRTAAESWADFKILTGYALLFGLALAGPSILVALIVWAALARLAWANARAAVALGAIIGAVAVGRLVIPEVAIPVRPTVIYLCVAITALGGLTGLAVWFVALWTPPSSVS